ncbi:hypothetical protein [Solicola sp. PLA-1-18]|uniref:hypothetical protein n=1 Tax=Solicola sp. PLA-1-18 TaxID=3380532 RepID=UPI003B823748
MTTDGSARATWSARVATTVDLLGAVACGVASGVLLVDHVQYSRVDHSELYGFETGMSLALGALCGLLGLVLAVAAWRRTRHAWGLAAATWVVACLPVSAVLSSVVPWDETPVWLLVALLVAGVGTNVMARVAPTDVDADEPHVVLDDA